MSYTKTTDFLAKDSLITGNPAKKVKGSELDTEFNNIAIADADNVKTSALGSGIATWLATPSSANLIAALTDESLLVPTALTAQATTSGTAIDFTGIPAGVSRVIVLFNDVSTSGTDVVIVQIGDSGGVETGADYLSYGYTADASPTGSSILIGFVTMNEGASTNSLIGRLVLEKITGTTWICSGLISTGSKFCTSNGSKSLSGVLDRIRITTLSGADTFDAGTINVIYE